MGDALYVVTLVNVVTLYCICYVMHMVVDCISQDVPTVAYFLAHKPPSHTFRYPAKVQRQENPTQTSARSARARNETLAWSKSLHKSTSLVPHAAD